MGVTWVDRRVAHASRALRLAPEDSAPPSGPKRRDRDAQRHPVPAKDCEKTQGDTMPETPEEAAARAARQILDKIRAWADDELERWGDDRIEQDRANVRPIRSQ